MANFIKRNSKINNVIDVGCGAGIDACCLAKLFPERFFIMYDFSKEMIKQAKERAYRLGLRNILPVLAEYDRVPAKKIDLIYIIGVPTEEENIIKETLNGEIASKLKRLEKARI